MTKKQKNVSSSEDEMFMNNIKDAIDQQFLCDDLYKDKTEILQSKFETGNKLHRKSLRINSEQEDIFTNFGISTTFQNFMAKQLDKILERTIKLKSYKNIALNYMGQKQKKKKNIGIKLLSSSETFLITESTKKHEKKIKRESCEVIEDDEALFKFQEAAIDSERILNKLDVEAWVNRRPEPDFKYKRLKNNILVEQV